MMVTVKLQNEKQDVYIKLEGVGNVVAKEALRKVFDSFLESFDEVHTQVVSQEPIHAIVDEKEEVEELSNTIYGDVSEGSFVQVNCTETNEEGNECLPSVVKKIEEIDYNVEFSNTDTDKYNREFPKIKNPMARNMYNKLVELQINQQSYFVTDNGELKLQGVYLCKCGNFKKHWVAYPEGRKFARCTDCSKSNTLVYTSNTFPSTDKFGNFYVTSNMIKKEK